MGLSAIILTKNSQDTIVDCIESIKFCDETVIIDDYSSDNTVELISQLKNKKIKVIKHYLDSDFSSQRNFAMTKANNEWILFIDSDEVISEKLQSSILSVLNSPKYDGYLIKRVDYLWGRKLFHGETGETSLLRLGRKDKGRWKGKVHEQWKIRGEVSSIKGELFHYSHKSILSFIEKINKYTTIRAHELYSQGYRVTISSIILYPLGKFIVNYLIKRGFLDSGAGFIHASLMSFHSFLVRAKLYLLQENISKNTSSI